MWIFTGKAVWLPLAFLILLVLIYKKNWRESLLILLAIVLVVTLCDQFALTSVSLSSPVSARLTILILWIRWKLFSDTGEDFTDLFPAMLRTLSVSRLLWHWSCGISCSLDNLFLGGSYCLYTGLSWGSFHFGYRAGSHFGCVLRLSGLQALFFSRSKLLPVQVNNGEPLYSKKRIRLIVYAIYVTILIIIVFNVPLAACLQNDTCRKAYLFIWNNFVAVIYND